MPKNLKANISPLEIRNEYNESKRHKEVIVEKSAYAWVEKNVVLINEKIDRRTIKRLIDSIVKFDEKFSVVKAKVPSVAKILDDAELSLNLVLSGKTSESRAEDILKHLSIIYTLLSDFFSGDLPVVLRAPMFKAARENPNVRIDSISSAAHDPKMIAGALETALRPSKDEIKLMSKVYRGVALPSLNASGAAKEMLSLTYEELVELSTMDRVPMVTTPPVPEKPAVDNMPAETMMEGLEGYILSEQNTVDKLETLMQNLGRVKNVINADPNLKAKLSGAYEKLHAAALKSYNSNEFLDYFAKLRRPADLAKSGQGKIIAQAEMAINAFKTLGSLAPTVEKMVDKEDLDFNDVKAIRAALGKALKGGLLSRAMNVFKTQPFPGLGPDDIIEALVSELESEAVNGPQNQNNQNQAQGQQAQQTQAQPQAQPQTVNEDRNTFLSAFKNIANASKSIVTGQDIAGTNPQTTPTTGADQTTAPAGTVGGGQTTGTQQTGQTSNASASQTTAPGTPGQGQTVELGRSTTQDQFQMASKKLKVPAQTLQQLANTRGVRVTLDPDYFKA